jgi:hypothetical protein
MFLEYTVCDGKMTTRETRKKKEVGFVLKHKHTIVTGLIYENDQQDAPVWGNLLFLDCSTCFERYFRSSSGASKLYFQLLVLFTYVVAGWCHG